MSLAIRGMGWVTPLGADVPTVWEKLLRGEEARAETITSLLSPRTYQAFRVPDNAPVHARLRRSSTISRLAVAAGLAALADAGLHPGADTERVALISATSNGGVIYTKRFYHDIVAAGAQSASPLLFPETVFNAPASHLAAIIGITGASYTLLGDGAVGVLALKMAEDLIQNEAVDHCLVVGAEEIDWLLCDAYRKWRLLRSAPPIELFDPALKGMILSEGAGALLLSRTGSVQIDQVSAGGNFLKRKDAAELLGGILAELEPKETDLIIGSANGTFIDLAEREALRQISPGSLVYTLKPALGESVGASAIWQVIAGTQALLTHRVPPMLHTYTENGWPRAKERTADESSQRVIISSCGLNQQAAGLRLSIAQ